MWITAELINEQGVFFDDTSYVEMIFARNGLALEETFGQDRFNFNGMVLPGKRLSGTGRSRRYSMDNLTGGIGLGLLEAPPACPVFFGLDMQDDLRLRVKTNLVLDAGVFAKLFTIGISVDGVKLEIPLARPDVEIEWVGRGEYSIAMGPFVLEAIKQRSLH